MIRLHITVEGQTEERFVKDTLSPYLANFDVFSKARCVLTSDNKKQHIEYRGGFRRHKAYSIVRKDIMNWISEDDNAECRFSTMFDFYALPGDFPGQEQIASVNDKYQKIKILENALRSDINDQRFIPYIQLHEFEALIFADPQHLDWEYLGYDSAIAALQGMLRIQPNPELINDSPETAPSKRIISQIPEYGRNKIAGASIVKKIGMEQLKNKCRHFCEWVEVLERLT